MLHEKDNKSSHMSDVRKNAYERVNAAYSQRARESFISLPFKKRKGMALDLSFFLFLSLFLYLFLFFSDRVYLSLTLSLSIALSFSLTLDFSLSLSFSLALSLSLFRSLTLSLPLSLHVQALFLSFALNLSRS